MIFLCQLSHTISMGYFNYHGKIRKLISEGKLVYFEIVDEYHGICPAMILHFNNHKSMPIREEHFDEYLKLMKFDKF